MVIFNKDAVRRFPGRVFLVLLSFIFSFLTLAAMEQEGEGCCCWGRRTRRVSPKIQTNITGCSRESDSDNDSVMGLRFKGESSDSDDSQKDSLQWKSTLNESFSGDTKSF